MGLAVSVVVADLDLATLWMHFLEADNSVVLGQEIDQSHREAPGLPRGEGGAGGGTVPAVGSQRRRHHLEGGGDCTMIVHDCTGLLHIIRGESFS